MTAARRCTARARLAVLAFVGIAALLAAARSRAQEPPPLPEPERAAASRADSAAVAAAMAASDSAQAAARRALYPPAKDRFELGVAIPEGYFDWLGTFGYRRRAAIDPRVEHWFHVELAGGSKDYLTEGVASFYWMMQPRRLIHREWKIRPVIEGGFGGHLTIQFARIRRVDDWASHGRGFVKLHGVAGFEADLNDRWGVALRGRLTVPSHRPLDYAQLVLLLR